ncbi:MAG: YbbR-like domain-containing protein, partial [Synergistaceae bacterium]|nr:YbbR-like domain-containing protein [Synergistaceae bacterium]
EGSVVIEPAQVRFKGTLARGLPKKRVPVNVRFKGELNADYEVRSIITDPSEIQIEGNSADLAKVETVDTETIDITLIDSNQVLAVPLKNPDIEGVTLNVSSVRVNLQLGETRAERKLTNIPVEIRGAAENEKYICNPSGVSITIEGRPSLIEAFEPGENTIRAFADMSNIFMAPVTLPVRTEIASADVFRVTRIEPQNVTVNVSGIN